MLIRGGTVVPMTAPGLAVTADVLVRDGLIAAVGSGLAPDSRSDVLDADGSLVLPGFVQTHVHVVQSLARNRAEGLPLLDWLIRRIWPYEAALTEDEVATAARLGIAELVLGGTTTALDMGTVHHHDAVFAAAERIGIRFVSGKCLMDRGDGVPDGLIESTEAALASCEQLGRRWHGAAAGRLRFAVAPRFVLSCSPELLTGAAALARRNGWLLHTHASENPAETAHVRELFGAGNLSVLARHGIAGRDTVIAHCVHLDDAEFDLVAREGTGVAHCPGANLKLASGIADLPRMLAAGARVGLGADGPPCNNRLSIFHEMALAGTVHALRHGAGAPPAWTVLELATWRGAEVLGLADRIGRIVPGMEADLVVLDKTAAMHPTADVAAMVVHGAGPEAVRHVVVAGRVIVHERTTPSLDVGEVFSDADRVATAIAQRLEWN